MLWAPAARPAVEQAAVPVLPLPMRATAPQPVIDVPPSLKLTLPVGALPATVAVNVTLAPRLDGLAELTSVVVTPLAGGGGAYMIVSLGRRVVSVAYSLELNCFALPPADVCMRRHP